MASRLRPAKTRLWVPNIRHKNGAKCSRVGANWLTSVGKLLAKWRFDEAKKKFWRDGGRRSLEEEFGGTSQLGDPPRTGKLKHNEIKYFKIMVCKKV
jgi:hypothetical protein